MSAYRPPAPPTHVRLALFGDGHEHWLRLTGSARGGWVNLLVTIPPSPSARKRSWRLEYSIHEDRFARGSELNHIAARRPDLLDAVGDIVKEWFAE